MAEGSGQDPIGRRAVAGGAGVAVVDQIIDALRETAEALIEEQKARIAESVRGVAEALHRVADSVAGDGAPATQTAGRAAERIDAISARLRDRPVGDLVAEVEGFAQCHPALFLLGAAVTGFALGRFVVVSGGCASRAEEAVPPAGSPVGPGRL